MSHLLWRIPTVYCDKLIIEWRPSVRGSWMHHRHADGSTVLHLCVPCNAVHISWFLTATEGELLRIPSPFHHWSICLLPCPNARRCVWHHIFKFTAKLYILSNSFNWKILVSAHMLPRLLSVYFIFTLQENWLKSLEFRIEPHPTWFTTNTHCTQAQRCKI